MLGIPNEEPPQSASFIVELWSKKQAEKHETTAQNSSMIRVNFEFIVSQLRLEKWCKIKIFTAIFLFYTKGVLPKMHSIRVNFVSCVLLSSFCSNGQGNASQYCQEIITNTTLP